MTFKSNITYTKHGPVKVFSQHCVGSAFQQLIGSLYEDVKLEADAAIAQSIRDGYSSNLRPYWEYINSRYVVHKRRKRERERRHNNVDKQQLKIVGIAIAGPHQLEWVCRDDEDNFFYKPILDIPKSQMANFFYKESYKYIGRNYNDVYNS